MNAVQRHPTQRFGASLNSSGGNAKPTGTMVQTNLETGSEIHPYLKGGDRRSTGRADELAADALAGKIDPGAVYAAMFDEDAVVRMRAADALEKISAQRPACLRPFKRDFLARLPGISQMEVRWHAAQMLPRFGLTAAEGRTLAVPVLLGYLRDKSRLVQTFALQALADFAAADRQLRPQVLGIIEHAARTGGPAVKARCRQLLPPLSAP